MSACFALHCSDESTQEWALSHLLAAGAYGCMPIDTSGALWSDYVFKLRRRGIDVETITETYDGPYAGHDDRCVLRSRVSPLSGQSSPPPSRGVNARAQVDNG